MVYSDFYTMESGFVYDAVRQNDRDKNPKTKLYCGLGAELGQGETDGDLPRLMADMDAAFAGGAQGISLYTIAGLNTPEKRQAFKAYADSMRAVRKANGGVIPPAKDQEISLVPFDHPELMQVIQRNMQRLVAGEAIHQKSINGMVPDDPSKVYPPLDLGEWELFYQDDRLTIYEVPDMASGTNFRVLIITYGELISGWDVRKI